MRESQNPPVFSTVTRSLVSASIAVGGAAMVWLVGPGTLGPDEVYRFVMAHAATAAPFIAISLVCSWRARRLGPPAYAVFWQRWLAASVLGSLSTISALLAVWLHSRAFLALDMLFLVMALPLWISAAILMARAQAGRRSVSVDLVDAATALVVLGAPGILLVAEPLAQTEKAFYAVPFATAAVLAPMSLYLSVVNLSRIPKGERAAHGIGTALATTALVNLTLQLARVLGGLDLPLRGFVAAHVLNLGLLAATPLWAHRRPVGRLALLPAHDQVRRGNPMPYISAVALPLLGVYVFATRDDRAWGVWFFLAVVLAVVVLNAVRYTVMSRETRRLYAGIAQMAEERRQLLARLLRGLEDDRHRTATELHAQAVGSLATLGTLVQMAHAALPGDSALTVKETVAQLQNDLSARAEHLRQLMLAIRPPTFGQTTTTSPTAGAASDPPAGTPTATPSGPAPSAKPGDDALGAALLAYASELWRDDPTPVVRVEVDPVLRLDWTTMTVVYRIAQEALLNAAKHAEASTVAVSVTEQQGHILIEVRDNGVGFEPHSIEAGTGMATMELFTHLGGGQLKMCSKPGQGTTVRSVLPGLTGRTSERASPGHAARPRRGTRHLHVIVSTKDTP